jgi:hypothetical protein
MFGRENDLDDIPDWFRRSLTRRWRRHLAAIRFPHEGAGDAAQGASDQLQALLLIEGFGLPKPSTEPITYSDLRM